MRIVPRFSRIYLTGLVLAAFALAAAALPSAALADTASDLYGTAFDRSDFYEPEEEYSQEDTVVTDVTTDEDAPEDEAPVPFSLRAASVRPMTFSDEIRYFCKWESGQNYDQGLSAGDGYHAMGYYQFDNRYGLGDFLQAVYNYNPGKYWALKQIGDWYGWNTYGNGGNVRTVKSPGGNWTMADDLNWSWHQAYAADPTEFSNLQNGWAYQEYYTTARNYLSTLGINLDARADSVKSLCWGMCNLFGSSGWRWFVKDAEISNSMTDAQMVSSLTNSIISGVSSRYPSQSQYWNGWRNRYRDECRAYLGFLGADTASLAAASKGTLAAGTYVMRMSNASGVFDVWGGSRDNGANVQIWGANGTAAQSWRVEVDDSGYVTLVNAGSGKALDVSGAGLWRGTNVAQWTPNGSDAQKWAPVRHADGSFSFHSKIGQGLVLDVAGGSSADGSNVQVWANNGSAAQRFVLEANIDDLAAAHRSDLSDGTYTVFAGVSPARVVDINGPSTADGANVHLWESLTTTSQRWTVSHDSAGYVTLTNAYSGKVLDVAAGQKAPGTNVAQWTANDSKAQKWVAVRSGRSYVLHSALGNGLVLDVSAGVSGNGVNLQVWSGNGSAAQRFGFADAGFQAASVDEGAYVVESSLGKSQVLDVWAASLSAGGNVQIYEGNGTMTQRWYIRPGQGRLFSLQSVQSGLYLTVADSGNVVQSAYESGASDWLLEQTDKGYVLHCAGSAVVLDVDAGIASNGRNVQGWTDNGSAAQAWSLTPASLVTEGEYGIVPVANLGQRLDVAAGSKDNGAAVRSWSSNDTAAQLWKLEESGDGALVLLNVGSDKALDVQYASTASGALVWQYEANGSDAQTWKVSMGSKGLVLTSGLGTVLDVAGGSAYDGATVHMWDANGSVAQQWLLVKRG